jgi:WXG100 family type VII secretion target
VSSPKIRADYDSLAQLSQSFQQQADATRQTLQQLKSKTDALRGGDWVGQGAQAYYQEMDGHVLPALGRLHNALEEAGRVTALISKMMKAAEEEASRILDGRGVAAGAIGAAVGAAIGGAIGGVVGGPAGAAAGAASGAAATGGLDPQVGQILSQSPTVAAQLAALEADGWTIVQGPADGGSFADRTTKTITINAGDTVEVTAGGLAHEIGHAATPEPPYHDPAGLTRDQYIDQNVQEQLRNEGEAQLNAAIARDEIGQAGGPDTGIPGSQTPAYQAVYVEFKAGTITRTEAIERMANLMGNESTSNTNENYRAYYGHTYEDFWDTNVAPAGGTP